VRQSDHVFRTARTLRAHDHEARIAVSPLCGESGFMRAVHMTED
jgi:hypothetical protein